MSDPQKQPTKTKSLVAFSSTKRGELSLTDRFHTENGEIVHTSCKTDVNFMVEYQGYWFAVHVDREGTKSHLRIHGVIGKLPYSYESTFARVNIMAVVRAAGKALGGNVRVDETQRIILIETITYEGTLSPKIIIAETTKALLRVKPYLQLVSELQPPKTASIPAPTNYKEQPDPAINAEQTGNTPPKADSQPIKKKIILKAKPAIKLTPNAKK